MANGARLVDPARRHAGHLRVGRADLVGAAMIRAIIIAITALMLAACLAAYGLWTDADLTTSTDAADALASITAQTDIKGETK